MKRLALITSRFPLGGRLEAFLHDEVEELGKHFDVTVVPAIPKMFSARVFFEASAEFLRRPILAARLFYRVTTAPRSIGARVRNASIFPKALTIARTLRREGIQHVHAYWLSTPSTVAYIVAEINGLPWSATGHRYDIVDYNITTVGEHNPGFLTGAQFIRTISERGRRQVLLALPKADVNTVHLGVHLPPVTPGRTSSSLVFRLICVANFTLVKAHEVLFRALRIVKTAGTPIICTLAGAGPEQRRLEHLASELDIADVVQFIGSVPRPELLGLLEHGAYDAAILTSADEGWHRSEGIPVSLIEAMAAGLPCIATNSGSVGELVDATNGILLEPGDERGIAKAIRALASDKALYERLAAAARATVARAFRVTATTEMLGRLLGAEREIDQCVSA